MKPWERALQREPMCAFVEAVVDGYSSLDKHLCKLARAGSLLRSLPWWNSIPYNNGFRGERNRTRHPSGGTGAEVGNALSGEIPWK